MYLSNDSTIEEELEKENLRYVSDTAPGYFRQKVGKKFEYYNLEGNKLKDDKTISRIESLVIPPAWKRVWICPKANGHIQATGIDEKNRKQYIYHHDWIKICQENKFSKMIDFGLNLPKIRNKIRYDMQNKKMDKKKILATIVWLLEHTFIRIGNEEYSKENNSFGLTTLRNKHVKVRGSDIQFHFMGKSGVENTLVVTNKIIAKTIKRCIELPGYELFQFIDQDNNRHVVDSQDVNSFLKDVTEDDFTAKDFRTWGASNLSAKYFYKLGFPEDKSILKKNIVETIKKVATHLNNTVSVCKNYYIHPTIINTYQKSFLIPHYNNHKTINKGGLTWDEYALIKLLQKYPYAPLALKI